MGGAQVDEPKDQIIGALMAPNGQEGCDVCHGAGAAFDTTLFHEQGPLD